jgi:hypothetical protein
MTITITNTTITTTTTTTKTTTTITTQALQLVRSSNEPPAVKSAIGALLLYINNALKDPKYRKILLTNSNYTKRVQSCKVHVWGCVMVTVMIL